MADNTTLDPGTGGDTIATDDVAGVKYQRVKLVDGTADSTTAIGGDATNGLDVDVTRVQGTVTVNGSGVTQPVSAASLPLPSGASTAAKQPALGTAGTASADVITVQGIASMTAVKTDGSGVTQPVSGTVTANAGTGTLSTNQAQVAGTATDVNSGNKSAGTQRVVLATDQPQLTNALKVDGSAVTQPVSGTVTANAGTGTMGVKILPQTAGGLTPDQRISAASTNATSIKASAGQLFGWYIYNDGAAEVYFKIYNKASAPTVGTDTPLMTIAIPAGSAANVFTDIGIAFGTGIATATTTAAAVADTGAVAANQLIANLFYA